MEKSILRLSDLAKEITEVYRINFSVKRYWVTAEILSLNINKGHCYFQLGEKDERSTQIKAEFKGFIWASNFNAIHSKFVTETGTSLQGDMEILCKVEVQFHERFGMGLLIHDIDPAYTLGKLALERKKTVAQLKQDGVYFLNKQHQIPAVIQNIAIISSSEAEGLKDFYSKLSNNVSGFVFHTKLFPSLMQGDHAAAGIIAALNQIKNHPCFPYLHAIVIVRGGGQISSLSCYNDYHLAYEVANYPLPVITGIGHTGDISVVDEVANLNLITPTAVADYLIQHATDFSNQINYLRDGIHAYANLCIENEEEQIEQLTNAILSNVNDNIDDEKKQLSNAAGTIKHSVAQEIISERGHLLHSKDKIKLFANAVIVSHKSKMQIDLIDLKNKIKQTINSQEVFLNNAQMKNDILDPVQILKRGFSYTLYNNKPVFDPNEVPLDAELETVVLKGVIKSKKTK